MSMCVQWRECEGAAREKLLAAPPSLAAMLGQASGPGHSYCNFINTVQAECTDHCAPQTW